MKLTRRDFATVLAPAAALAGTPTAPPDAPPHPQAGGDALLDAARARVKANGAVLAEQDIPMDAEPAFQFKA
ncbi:MAG TPA: hypothetical protein VKF41_04290 [Bryobacteraceae bacterium]|nr:hypothetical protein [Bryobacteraceae bacterium]